MNKSHPLFICFGILLLFGCVGNVHAGPFAPGTEYEPYDPVHMDSSDILAWATGWVEPVNYGSEVDPEWKTPEKALGKAKGDAYDIVSLGRGGAITLTFYRPIRDGEGWDFAVFENAAVFDEDTGLGFLELAYVEVSSNGIDFVRFDNYSLTPNAVDAFGKLDHTLIHNLAGKYKQGLGTPFDLADLSLKQSVINKTVDTQNITHVRIVDIVGDGTYMENRPPEYEPNNPIYDPYPTTGSAGFDLDAVAVRYQTKVKDNRVDLNGDGVSDLADAVLGLQVLIGNRPNLRDDVVHSTADVNADGRIGLDEIVYILRANSE